MSDKLKPCAHCGAPGMIKRGKTVMVSCMSCTSSTFQLLDDRESAIAAWNRRAAPVSAPMGQELPPLPERDGDWAGDNWFTADSMQDYARQAIAQRDERIRHLERELEQSRAAFKGSENARRIAEQVAERKPASIVKDMELDRLLAECEASTRFGDPRDPADMVRTLIAYIDGRAAGTAPALIAALKPFADAYAPRAEHDDPNEAPNMRAFLDRNTITPSVTIGDFRRAYEAYRIAAAPTPVNNGMEEANGKG